MLGSSTQIPNDLELARSGTAVALGGGVHVQTAISSTQPDAGLVRAAQGGDASALNELLRRHQPAIERICRRLCNDDAHVDDVVQETCLAIVRNIRSYRGDASFLTWVYTIARTHRGRATRSAQREETRRQNFGSLVVDMTSADSSLERSSLRELTSALEHALAPLRSTDREIIIMRDVEGRSASEIAAALELTVPAVKTRLHRARTVVRKRLEAFRAVL